MLADFKKGPTERLPFELWFNAEVQDDVVVEVGGLMEQELVGRPGNGPLYPIGKPGSRPGFGKVEELLGLNLCQPGGFPPVYQKFYRRCCRIDGVIPPGKGRNNYRTA